MINNHEYDIIMTTWFFMSTMTLKFTEYIYFISDHSIRKV